MSSLGNKEIFARNLKFYIDKSGKDRRELAEIWGFPYSTLSEWINARKYPRIDRIEIMADYFGVQKSDLIEEKMTEEKEKDNDLLAEIIVRMRMEEDFREAVESLYLLDTSRIKGVKQLLQAFTQQPEDKV